MFIQKTKQKRLGSEYANKRGASGGKIHCERSAQPQRNAGFEKNRTGCTSKLENSVNHLKYWIVLLSFYILLSRPTMVDKKCTVWVSNYYC